MSRTPGALRLALVLSLLGSLLGVLAPTLTPPAGAQPRPEAALVTTTQVDAGWTHTCAVLSTRQVRCWGSATFRQVGDGNIGARYLPVTVLRPDGAGPLTGITQVSAGNAHTCARTAGGQARCWGYNGEAELGVGDQSPHDYAVAVDGVGGTGRLTGVRQVVTGWDHSCARVAGGQVRCWGDNSDRQMGDGTPTLRPSPVAVSNPDGTGPLTGVTQLSAGLAFTCARLSSGQAVCWGNGEAKQLGDGGTADRSRPVAVENSAGTGPLTGVRQVATGSYFACALLTNGQARCWGALPNGSEPQPVGVLNGTGTGPLTGIAGISAGHNHLCFRLTNGQVRCTGVNADGQLGDRTTTGRPGVVSMVNVAGTANMTGVAAVTAGEKHTCVRFTNGQLACTGANGSGQLGDGTGQGTARPVGVRRN